MNTNQFELKHLRLGGNVSQKFQTSETSRLSLAALNAVILPLLLRQTNEEAVRHVLASELCKVTLDSFGVTDSTSNTSPDDAVACMAEMKSRRIPFKHVVHNGYCFTFLLHQDAYDPHGLHRALTTGNTAVLTSPAAQPPVVPVITPVPPVVIKVETAPATPVVTTSPAAEIETVTAPLPPVVTVEGVTPEPSADEGDNHHVPKKLTAAEFHHIAEVAERLMERFGRRLKTA